MPKKTRLKLDALKVQSFVTGEEQRDLRGGVSGSDCAIIACPPTNDSDCVCGGGQSPPAPTVRDFTCIDWYCDTILTSEPPQIIC